MLREELLATRWKMHSSGKILIEPKEIIKKRIGRSPDFADSVAMAFWDGARGAAGISFSSMQP